MKRFINLCNPQWLERNPAHSYRVAAQMSSCISNVNGDGPKSVTAPRGPRVYFWREAAEGFVSFRPLANIFVDDHS